MIRLLVADDHPVVRNGIRSLLRDATGIRVAAEARSLADVLQQIGAREFDAVLLDLSFPDGDGLDVLPALRACDPPIPVVVFTNSITAARRCADAGAAAFVSKDATTSELCSAIEAAVAGRRFVGVRASQSVKDVVEPDPEQHPHLSLSPRELEIMLKLVRGMRPKEIGCELEISEKTVATHRARLMRKLGVADMRQLLLYALRTGLTDWC